VNCSRHKCDCLAACDRKTGHGAARREDGGVRAPDSVMRRRRGRPATLARRPAPVPRAGLPGKSAASPSTAWPSPVTGHSVTGATFPLRVAMHTAATCGRRRTVASRSGQGEPVFSLGLAGRGESACLSAWRVQGGPLGSCCYDVLMEEKVHQDFSNSVVCVPDVFGYAISASALPPTGRAARPASLVFPRIPLHS
jgi:hypothetical protein